MDLGGSNAVEILGKALRVWNIEDIAVGVGWFGWELGIILYPQELMMAGSMQGVTQRSFLHTEQGCRVLWGTEGKDGGHQGHACMYSGAGVQLLILQLPKCLRARRDGLHWARHSTCWVLAPGELCCGQ